MMFLKPFDVNNQQNHRCRQEAIGDRTVSSINFRRDLVGAGAPSMQCSGFYHYIFPSFPSFQASVTVMCESGFGFESGFKAF